jgi:hypothetical protein
VNFFNRHQGNRILDRCLNIGNAEIRVIVPDDFLERKPFVQQFKNALHRNTGTGYTGFSEVNVWIDGDFIDHGIALENQ